ncbi:HNH endonuclease [Actinomadura sediminis]|uniref:HNH endonuclease n=1 Tax=Actinomadura sediminis TaxID=1038904 RepID=A0ABW3EPR1_9ACTN
MGAHAGRKGRTWRRVRERVLTDHGGICWICGHPGAGSVDHVIPRVHLLATGRDPEDPSNLRPAHGALSRCETCGQACNEVKGAREHVPRAQGSRAW